MAHSTKQPKNLSPRVTWLRDYYFQGIKRPWNNRFIPFTTGVPWDELYEEMSFYIVPETYSFFEALRLGYKQNAYPVELPQNFWSLSLPERRAWFVRECMVNRLPQEVLPGDLIAGGRFSLMASRCWSEKEARERNGLLFGKKGLRAQVFEYHDRGFGNLGPTSGHLIPDYATVLQKGFDGIGRHIQACYDALSAAEKTGPKGAQLRAMLVSATMPGQLAEKYAAECARQAQEQQDPARKQELQTMERILRKVPLLPAEDFHEALQSLFLAHMLVLCDECYPGAGVSFGRIDQYLLPYWQKSLDAGQDREWLKELLKCFFLKCNYAYDSMIYTGNNQGITAGFGQLFNLSGLGAEGKDMTNDLTYAFLEVIDDLSPLLEPKPNVRLHRNSPDALLNKVSDMIAESQGAPFLLNFDERSMAGMLREAERAGVQQYIHPGNVFDYACVGCLENTMVGNDRSGTVDINVNLAKAVEYTLTGGVDLRRYTNAMGDKSYDPEKNGGLPTPTSFATFAEFYAAFEKQLSAILDRTYDLYNRLDAVRARFSPTPYLSCLLKGCAESGKDITQGGAEMMFTTVEGVTFATTVDSLLAIESLVFDKQDCSLQELVTALKDNWQGHEILQAKAKNKTPKYGRDDDQADEMARRVMDFWSEAVWKYKTTVSGQQFRGGMLSWNYWVSDGYILAATPDGRQRGQFLSNAICPSNGADVNGPTANANSVGKALGGKAEQGDFEQYLNCLPNGASHTITFGPSLLRDDAHREKFKSFLRGYCENGGTALQVNILDADLLRDAQQHPENYRHLLVRVTGYNAYFTSVGRELQNEIIARESHNKW